MRDLRDIALPEETGTLAASNRARTITETFAHRSAHLVPLQLPDTAAGWALGYTRMAEDGGGTASPDGIRTEK